MIKAKIDYKHSIALSEHLEKEFDVAFSVIDAGEHIGLIEKEEITEHGRKRIASSIRAFQAGVDAVTPLLDEIQEHADLIKIKIEQM